MVLPCDPKPSGGGGSGLHCQIRVNRLLAIHNQRRLNTLDRGLGCQFQRVLDILHRLLGDFSHDIQFSAAQIGHRIEDLHPLCGIIKRRWTTAAAERFWAAVAPARQVIVTRNCIAVSFAVLSVSLC